MLLPALLSESTLTQKASTALYGLSYFPPEFVPQVGDRRFTAACRFRLSRAFRSTAGTRLKEPNELFTRIGHLEGDYGPDPRQGLLLDSCQASPL